MAAELETIAKNDGWDVVPNNIFPTSDPPLSTQKMVAAGWRSLCGDNLRQH